ncbi:MAG TPA: hypothetical protein PLO23_06125, partial [Alphaproteobacteria bacterium]|nr:hypothetical protein [Alphaproteobacteria bacterium]
MSFDNRPYPLTVSWLMLRPDLGPFDWPDLEKAFGAFDPNPAPWQAWEGLGIGQNPDLPLDFEEDDKFSSIYGYRARWEKQDSKFSLTDFFTRTVFFFNPVVYYNVVGGSLAIPGGQARKFAEGIHSFATISDFEAMRRSIIADEYGSAGFEDGDIKRGRVLDPRLRDWASRETNVRITNEAAETLMMGLDYTMLWPGQALYPEQTKVIGRLVSGQGRLMIKRLIAGTQDIEKTLKEAYEHGVKTGEWMHPRQIIATVRDFSKNFEKAAEAADVVRLYNTDGPEPVLIAQKNGSNGKLEWLKDVGTDPAIKGRMYDLYYKFYEQQYYNPAGQSLKEIDARRALHELFGPKPAPSPAA